MTYECSICLNVNHASKLHCSTCGTTPAKYSVSGKPERQELSESGAVNYAIEAVLAKGHDRAEWHRTSRVYLRTVKADYYAEA